MIGRIRENYDMTCRPSICRNKNVINKNKKRFLANMEHFAQIEYNHQPADFLKGAVYHTTLGIQQIKIGLETGRLLRDPNTHSA
jgi:hypothetical protein